jgi:hypothetical protein
MHGATATQSLSTISLQYLLAHVMGRSSSFIAVLVFFEVVHTRRVMRLVALPPYLSRIISTVSPTSTLILLTFIFPEVTDHLFVADRVPVFFGMRKDHSVFQIGEDFGYLASGGGGHRALLRIFVRLKGRPFAPNSHAFIFCRVLKYQKLQFCSFAP